MPPTANSPAPLFLRRDRLPVGRLRRVARLGLYVVTGLSLLIPCRSRAQDKASVEGTVQLPKSPPQSAAAGARYGIAPAGQAAGTPDASVAVVYLEGNFARKPVPSDPAQMAQHHAQFAPGVLVVQVGTTVEFPNLDDFYHNVFSYSKPKHFDLGRYRKEEKPAVQVFDKPGVVVLHCEIHESMRGTILVLDTPYFVKTDPAGRYRLDGLPAGHFVLKTWLNEKATLEHPVDLEARNTAHVSFP